MFYSAVYLCAHCSLCYRKHREYIVVKIAELSCTFISLGEAGVTVAQLIFDEYDRQHVFLYLIYCPNSLNIVDSGESDRYQFHIDALMT